MNDTEEKNFFENNETVASDTASDEISAENQENVEEGLSEEVTEASQNVKTDSIPDNTSVDEDDIEIILYPDDETSENEKSDEVPFSVKEESDNVNNNAQRMHADNLQNTGYPNGNGNIYNNQYPYSNNTQPPVYHYGNNVQPPFYYNGANTQQFQQPNGNSYLSAPYIYNGSPSYPPYPYSDNMQQASSSEAKNAESPEKNISYAYDNNDNKKKKNGGKIFAVIAGVMCVLLVAALVILIVVDVIVADTDDVDPTDEPGVSQNVDEFVTNASPETEGVESADGELHPKTIYEKVLPSSVGILVYDRSGSLAGEGSGVLFQESSDGKYTYIVTCAHVISDSTGDILVQLYDSSEYEAVIVGYDTRTDIGVLRISANGLTLADIGDSSKISVGDSIYAIGNPGGVEFANSFTNGMVSALDRPVNSSSTGYTMDCIQHTAAINPGNSGGALVNSFGQVIGINSMKIVADEYEGMGFAVPSSVFVKIVNELMVNGYVTNRPKLGITYVPATDYSSYGMFVAIKGLPSGSIVIYNIADDSALVGTKAQTGDLIVGVNGVDLDSPSDLSELIENSEIGDEITLSIVRIYKDYTYDEFEVTVKLVEDKGNSTINSNQDEDFENRLPDGFLP